MFGMISSVFSAYQAEYLLPVLGTSVPCLYVIEWNFLLPPRRPPSYQLSSLLVPKGVSRFGPDGRPLLLLSPCLAAFCSPSPEYSKDFFLFLAFIRFFSQPSTFCPLTFSDLFPLPPFDRSLRFARTSRNLFEPRVVSVPSLLFSYALAYVPTLLFSSAEVNTLSTPILGRGSLRFLPRSQRRDFGCFLFAPAVAGGRFNILSA